jgi:exopolysaccharide biosynthesis polyprenyl glycosylphosphotransferase
MVSVVTDVSTVLSSRAAKTGARSINAFVPFLVLGDLLAIALSTLAALLGRHLITADGWIGVVNPIDMVVGVLWLAFLVGFGTYRARYRLQGMEEFQRVATASFATAAATGVFSYLAQHELSRAFFLCLFAIGIPVLLTERAIARGIGRRMRIEGFMSQDVLVAGDPGKIGEIAGVLRRERGLGFRVLGALVRSDSPITGDVHGIPVVGTLDDASRIADASGAGAVIFCEGSFDNSSDFRRSAWRFENSRAQMMVVPGVTDVSAGRLNMRPVAGMSLIQVDQPQAMQAGKLLKRAFDLVVTSVLLVLASPIMLITAIAIKLEDGGPVLYKQTRVGRNGELFWCYKFRSMCTDADKLLAGLQSLNEGSGVLFKMASDPRVTRVGAFIRRFSIDEIPQFFNVMRGEMSLIGPRPALPTEVARYEPDVLRRLAVRPGLTGLWQVSGRSDLSWSETVRLDLYYVDNWSMVSDVAIMAKTLNAVLRSRGAY